MGRFIGVVTESVTSDTESPTPVSAITAERGEAAGFWIRLLAWLVDMAVAFALFTLTSAVLGYTALGLAAQVFLSFVPPMGYFALLWSNEGGGKTLGMRLFGLRLVNEEGNAPTLERAFLRLVVMSAMVIIPLGFLFLLWVTNELPGMFGLQRDLVRDRVPVVGRLAEQSLASGANIFGLVALGILVLLPVFTILALIDEPQKRGAYDHAAGTYVLRGKRI